VPEANVAHVHEFPAFRGEVGEQAVDAWVFVFEMMDIACG
jgi:hypothetical protein